MDDVKAALVAEQDALTARLDGLEPADWARGSRCPGWSVADVVVHLAQTNEMAIGSVEGRFSEALAPLTAGIPAAGSVDDGADALVAHERGSPPDAILERWTASVHRFTDALGHVDPHQRVMWVAGELSVHTLTTTRLAETWIHAGDVATAFGRPPAATDRLRFIARLAWRTLPYTFQRAGTALAGPVAVRLRAPSGGVWAFEPEGAAATTVEGDAEAFCLVAGRRADPADTDLRAAGADADRVLELVRTFA